MSSELDADADRFATGTGIWHIVGRDCVGDPERLVHGLVRGQLKDGRSYVVAFTDEDLAERFIERQRADLPDVVAFPFRNPQAWATFLEHLPEIGYEYIGLDPEPNGRIAEFGPIVELIRNVREANPGPGPE